jgi:hypothetical protein
MRAVGRVHGVVMLLEAATFGVAAALHLDVRWQFGFRIVRGEHATNSAIAELVMAGVLVLCALVVLPRPVQGRPLAWLATGFTLVGVIYELAAIAIGFGPRTIADLVYLIVMMVALLISFAVLMNRRRVR